MHESLHDRCPGSCCRGTCPGAVLRSIARWAPPLALVGCCAVFVMAQTIRTAIVWVGLQITVGGELTRAPAVNTSFWSSVSDGLDDGFWLSQGAIAAFSGVWPYLCMVILLLLWFIPRSLRSWITASILGTKWCVWYLIFAFLQALAFQYRAVITLLPGNPIEFRTFLDVDIQASDGVYLLAAGSIVIQTVGNIVFIADARLGTGGEEAHTDKWDKPAEDQTCYPLFLTMFWRSSRSAEYNWACPRVLTMVWATLCQLVVAALLVCGVALTAAGLVEDLFTTRQQAGIELEITLREPNRTEALLPLTFAVANGSLAGPGVELDTYEVLGQLILSSIFFVVFVLAPLLLFVVLAVIWAVPLTSRWRKVAVNAAILCQSWFVLPPILPKLATDKASSDCLLYSSSQSALLSMFVAQELPRHVRTGIVRRGF